MSEMCNNHDSFSDLMCRTRKKVKDYIRGLCGNDQDAEDITQEAFLRAYRAFGQFNNVSAFDTWVSAIARNFYYDVCRKAQRSVKIVDVPSDACDYLVDQLPDRSEQQDPYATLISELGFAHVTRLLDDPQFAVIRMVILEGRTYAEVASLLNIRIGTVKSRYNRQVRTLRQMRTSATCRLATDLS